MFSASPGATTMVSTTMWGRRVALLGVVASSIHAVWALKSPNTPLNRQYPTLKISSEIPGLNATDVSSIFPQAAFEQPLDHFGDSGDTFLQYYWVNSRHYLPGGPVICLDSGESAGVSRLPFLNTGVADILAEATHGLAIVLEHRYYGSSLPTANFTTDSLRWLTTEQSLADSANFIKSFSWNGTELSPPNTKWIYYGGSYAGARAALMRVKYPNLVFGSIASSAVTHATVDYWGYFEAIRTTANQTCMSLLTESVAYIDEQLSRNNVTNSAIKTFFGLSGLSDGDFGNVLTFPLSDLQGSNWDPAVSDDTFTEFCEYLGTGKASSHPSDVRIRTAVQNYASWLKDNVIGACALDPNSCFDTGNPSDYSATDLSQTWRAWSWQTCTQWGFFSAAPPDPLYPRIISKSQTLEYATRICDYAFPPGNFTRVPSVPDVEAVNKYGGFNIAHDRLAFIDGYYDPWRHATPHSPTARPRADTVSRPFKLISNGVHHWDENGVADHAAEPPTIKEIHSQEVQFVKTWLGI